MFRQFILVCYSKIRRSRVRLSRVRYSSVRHSRTHHSKITPFETQHSRVRHSRRSFWAAHLRPIFSILFFFLVHSQRAFSFFFCFPIMHIQANRRLIRSLELWVWCFQPFCDLENTLRIYSVIVVFCLFGCFLFFFFFSLPGGQYWSIVGKSSTALTIISNQQLIIRTWSFGTQHKLLLLYR